MKRVAATGTHAVPFLQRDPVVRQLICGFILLMTIVPLAAEDRCPALTVRGSELWTGEGREARLLVRDSFGVINARWSPDRQRIAYVHASSQSQHGVTDVIVLDTRDLSLTAIANLTWEDSLTAVLRLGWHGDDAVWIEGHVNPSTSIYYEWDVTTKKRVREIRGSRFAWSSDGRHLAHLEHRMHFTTDASRPPAIVVDGRTIWSATDSEERIGSPLTWSPDSKRLAFLTDRGEKSALNVIDSNGRLAAKSLAVDGERPARVRWERGGPVPAPGEEDTGCGPD
jgi:Tol biopolymer transport system component